MSTSTISLDKILDKNTIRYISDKQKIDLEKLPYFAFQDMVERISEITNEDDLSDCIPAIACDIYVTTKPLADFVHNTLPYAVISVEILEADLNIFNQYTGLSTTECNAIQAEAEKGYSVVDDVIVENGRRGCNCTSCFAYDEIHVIDYGSLRCILGF